MQSEQFIIENGKKYKNRKGNFEFHSISSLKNFLDNYTESQLKEADSKAVRFGQKIDFVIEMWKDPKNEMDFIHTLETLKAELFEIFEQENK